MNNYRVKQKIALVGVILLFTLFILHLKGIDRNIPVDDTPYVTSNDILVTRRNNKLLINAKNDKVVGSGVRIFEFKDYNNTVLNSDYLQDKLCVNTSLSVR